jgi:predicted ferric reductase
MSAYWLAQGVGVSPFLSVLPPLSTATNALQAPAGLYSATIGAHFFLMGACLPV